jgi:YlmC/YmxH family sporulation protein
MMPVRLCELAEKEVVNTVDGSSLGNVADLEFDPKCGQICAIVVPGPGKCFGLLGREYELVIPWGCICRIGPDVVLVEIDVDKCKQKG